MPGVVIDCKTRCACTCWRLAVPMWVLTTSFLNVFRVRSVVCCRLGDVTSSRERRRGCKYMYKYICALQSTHLRVRVCVAG